MDMKAVFGFMVPAAAIVTVLRKKIQNRRMFTSASSPTKINKLIEEGPDHLQILMDFDRTMTTYDSESAYGIVEEARSDVVKKAARDMFHHYYAIETSHTLTTEEKIPHMKEWYEKAHDLFLTDKFKESDIAHAVSVGKVTLRPGVREIIDFSGRTGVPLLIFSAGIGNVLKAVLEHQYGALPASVQIVSNWMQFDAKGNLTGWTEPLVHMYNKNESHLRSSALYPDLLKRKHVILVGDSLGDVTMADGLPHELVLKVGLLNHKVDAFLSQYRAEFDLVLINDAPLDPLSNLLHELEGIHC